MAFEKRAKAADGTTRQHAPSDVRIRGFIIFFVGFIVLGGLIHLTVYFTYGRMLARRETSPAPPLAQAVPLPPEPRIEGSAAHPELPAVELAEMRRREQELSTTYGWTSREEGFVRIPIRRAMDLVLQRGLPRFESSKTSSGE